MDGVFGCRLRVVLCCVLLPTHEQNPLKPDSSGTAKNDPNYRQPKVQSTPRRNVLSDGRGGWMIRGTHSVNQNREKNISSKEK